MQSKNLLTAWSRTDSDRLFPKQISVRLPVHVIARIRALEEMYPLRTRTQLIGDLLSAALDELEAEFLQCRATLLGASGPHFKVPPYEMRGLGLQFRAKANKHYVRLERELGNQSPFPLFASDTYGDVENEFGD